VSDPNRYERALASDAFEHDDTAGPKVKRVGNYIYNEDSLEWEKWDGTVSTSGFEPGATVTTTISVDGNTITSTDGTKTLTTVVSGNTITETWS